MWEESGRVEQKGEAGTRRVRKVAREKQWPIFNLQLPLSYSKPASHTAWLFLKATEAQKTPDEEGAEGAGGWECGHPLHSCPQSCLHPSNALVPTAGLRGRAGSPFGQPLSGAKEDSGLLELALEWLGFHPLVPWWKGWRGNWLNQLCLEASHLHLRCVGPEGTFQPCWRQRAGGRGAGREAKWVGSWGHCTSGEGPKVQERACQGPGPSGRVQPWLELCSFTICMLTSYG